jgi:hypothetical protein
MRTVTIQLESISSYSQSKKIDRDFPRNKDEPWNDYEARVWKEKAHYAEDGRVFIPQFAFKQAIDGASKYLGKIGGKGNARDTITSVWISANANGKRGSGTRVDRCFPVIPKWSGSLKCVILADEITKDAFAQALEFAGSLTGIGRFRPENGGNNGRFVVKKITWN